MRVTKIPTSTRAFFYHWVEFTRPFHKLGKMQKKVLAELLYHRYLLTLEVSNSKLVNKLLFSPDIKKNIVASAGTNPKRLDLILSEFRKKGIVKDNIIVDNYIPDIKLGDKEFVLAFKFKITDNEQGVFEKKNRQKDTADS